MYIVLNYKNDLISESLIFIMKNILVTMFAFSFITSGFFIGVKADSAKKYKNRSVTRIIKRDYQGALQDLNKAIKINPNNADYFASRGMLKIVMNDKRGGCFDLKKSSLMGDRKARKLFQEYCL